MNITTTIGLIIGFSLLSLFIGIYVTYKISNKKIKQYKDAELNQFNIVSNEYKSELNQLSEAINYSKQNLNNFNERINDAINHEKQLIESEANNARALCMEKLKNKLETFNRLELERLQREHEVVLSRMFDEQTSLNELITPLREELAEYRAKRDAINASIMRERELEMEKDFHRIILTNEAKDDIKYLLSIEDKLNNVQVLRKLIYETYLRPPLNEMLKRTLNNEDFSGIYRITDSNGRCYIGKGVSVKSRITDHIKSSIGLDTIAHQSIHDYIKSRGFDDFTFEVLERCSKEELGLREKFYIDFYGANITGYNLRAGG